MLLDDLQRNVLVEGELLLEYVVAPDTTFLFAITKNDARVAGLPGQRALATTLGLAHDLFAVAPHDAAAVAAIDRPI